MKVVPLSGFAFKIYLTIVSLDDIVSNGKPKTCPLANFFGGEEGLKIRLVTSGGIPHPVSETEM